MTKFWRVFSKIKAVSVIVFSPSDFLPRKISEAHLHPVLGLRHSISGYNPFKAHLNW